MPPGRTRPARSPSALRPTRATEAERERDADGEIDERSSEHSPDDADAASPLQAIVDAAADAGVVDPRGLADQLGVDAGAFRALLARPDGLTREQTARLAAALGVDQALLRAASVATARRTPRRGPAEALVSELEPPEPPMAGPPLAEPPVAELPLAEQPLAAVPLADVPPAEPFAVRPRSTAELLERTLAAVADDGPGRQARLALLAAAQWAAAEAGRPAPPEVHELRGRVLRGGLSWVGGESTVPDERHALDDRALVASVAGAVRRAQARQGGYDDLFAPLHDDALAALLRREAAAPRLEALGPTSTCLVTPPLFGRHLVLHSAGAGADGRRVALRRALGHLLLGHVDECAPLPFPEPPALARAADLFALADLVPFWQMADWRRGARLGWGAIAARVGGVAAGLAVDWEASRAAEAGRLRVLLYREERL